VRLDIRRIESIKNGTDVIGSRAKVKVVKNKTAPPFRIAEFDIMYNEGISREGNILDVAVDMNVVRKSGAWFYLGEDRIGQGRENVKQFLKEHPELTAEIDGLIRAQMSNQPEVPVLVGADEDDDGDGMFEEA
jgi:recombination protein RecA